MPALDGERSREARDWDARACLSIGAAILDYLEQHPAPVGSACAHDLGEWADRLTRSGDDRLAELRQGRHLEAVV